jgi:hypothetical protein
VDPSLDPDERARRILRRNDRGGSTVPTAGLYPFQWNWDSAFAAWGWSTFDVDRAWTELETLFTGQWSTGMVPHIVFHRDDPGYFPGPAVWGTAHVPPTSGISQPPVAASLARRLHDADPVVGRTRLAGLYPRLVASHRWWHEHRCGAGPAAVTHPWESGRDNAPAWDAAIARVDTAGITPYERRDTLHVDASMRPQQLDYDRYVAILEFGRSCRWDQERIVAEGPFLVADPMVTFVLLRAHRDLAALGALLGEDVTEIEGWADELSAAVPRLWNDALGCHDALDLRTGTYAGSVTAGGFLEWYAGIDRPEIRDRLTSIWERVRFGIPTNDPAAPTFDRRRYWRGPVWPVVSSLVAIGLEETDHAELAARLRRETRSLIERGGFAEYFDPIDGTPCGGAEFTWTAAVWLTWAGR